MITIVVVCDNHLVVMLAALLKSIEMNHVGSELITIYIVHDKISKKNMAKVQKTVSSTKIALEWRSLESVVPIGVKLPLDRTSFPVCAYARLCVPYFLSSDIKKVIYLDVDMLVLNDIKVLWSVDIGDHTLAAVVDRAEVVSSPWGGIKNYEALGLDPDTKYFNSGLMVINLEKWRANKFTESVINVINANLRHVTFADQYGLNIVFAKQWFILDKRWNSYAQTEVSDPFIIHFTGIKPIYKGYNFSLDYQDKFNKYLALTPWANFKPKSRYSRLFKKLWNVATKKFTVS